MVLQININFLSNPGWLRELLLFGTRSFYRARTKDGKATNINLGAYLLF